MVGTVETLPADLTQKLLALWIWVNKDVTLELVLTAKFLPAHLTGYGDLFRLAALCTYDQVPHHLYRLECRRVSLDEGQAFAVDGVGPQDPTHEAPLGDGVS